MEEARDLLLILSCVFLFFLGGLAYALHFQRRSTQALSALHNWARENEYEILTASISPLMLTTDGATFTYDVLLRRPDGSEARAWVVAGGFIGRVRTQDDVAVSWEGES